ncbi:MAG: hypothetical protein U1E78_02970 [Gammaproteobacteria bacterium]
MLENGYLRELQRLEEERKSKLQRNIDQNKTSWQILLEGMNQAKQAQQRTAEVKRNKKQKYESNLYQNLDQILNGTLQQGMQHLNQIAEDKLRNASPTSTQRGLIDSMKKLGGIELSGFVTNLLTTALSFAKDNIIPNLMPLIQKGIQQIGSIFSKRVDHVMSNLVDFSFQTEAIKSAAQIIYDMTPGILDLLPEALRASQPSEAQSNLLSEFCSTIQSRFKNKKPPLEFIQGIVQKMAFAKPIVQQAFQEHLPQLQSKTQDLESEFNWRVKGLLGLGKPLDVAKDLAKMMMQKEGKVIDFDALSHKSPVRHTTSPKSEHKRTEKEKKLRQNKGQNRRNQRKN